MTSKFPILAAAFLVVSAGNVKADDVTDQINQALQAYEKHDLATAASALDAAGRLLRQSAADNWKAALPAPLTGWTASDADSVIVAAAILGGGVQVSRTYQKGDLSVEISLIVDSPVMQSVGGLLNSGIFNGDDSKLVVIDGRKTTYAKSEHSYTTVAGKALITVKGETVDDATLRSYLKAINFAEIEKMSSK